MSDAWIYSEAQLLFLDRNSLLGSILGKKNKTRPLPTRKKKEKKEYKARKEKHSQNRHCPENQT